MGIFGGMGKGGWGNALSIIGATLKDVSDPDGGSSLMALQQLMGARQEQARKQELQAKLASMLSPQYEDGPAPMISMPEQQPGPSLGEISLGGPQPVRLPNMELGGGVPPVSLADAPFQHTGADPVRMPDPWAYQAPKRLPQRSLSDPQVQQALIAASLARLPGVGDLVNVLDKGRTKVENFNGFAVDPYNTKPGTHFPDLEKGQEPLYDGRGNIVGVRNMDGSVQAAAERAGAVKGAEARATAPFEFVNLPTDPVSGAPRMGSKAWAAGQRGPITGRSPTDAIRAEGLARGDVERADAIQARAATAGRQLEALDNMEALLPDVIAGFGADAKLQVNRALAAAGDQTAAKRVSATETFLNQGRVLVADIIRTFGANPTEGERKYAERMSGADAQLNPETLKEGIRLQRERIRRDLAAAGKTGTTRPDRSAVEAELRRRGLIQ